MRLTTPTILLAGSLAVAACSNDVSPGNPSPPPPDKTAPTVAIVAPAAGTVAGQVLIAVNATDASGIATVQWKINGALLAAVDSTAPYEYAWNTALNGPGTYAWTAVATDRAGNTAESVPVTLMVGP